MEEHAAELKEARKSRKLTDKEERFLAEYESLKGAGLFEPPRVPGAKGKQQAKKKSAPAAAADDEYTYYSSSSEVEPLQAPKTPTERRMAKTLSEGEEEEERRKKARDERRRAEAEKAAEKKKKERDERRRAEAEEEEERRQWREEVQKRERKAAERQRRQEREEWERLREELQEEARARREEHEEQMRELRETQRRWQRETADEAEEWRRARREDRRQDWQRPARRDELPGRYERPPRREERATWRDHLFPASSSEGWGRASQSSAEDSRRAGASDRKGGRSGKGRGTRESYIGREVDIQPGQPLDKNRGGGATKVAVLLSAYDRAGVGAELKELAERFLDELGARTTPVANNSWADKLRRLCTAIGHDQGREIRDMAEDYRRFPAVKAAMNNRAWQGWRERGY
ncbi:unnamed protein product, partial [Symbiodinium necroappetens]